MSDRESSGIRKWDESDHPVDHGHSHDGEVADADVDTDVKFPDEITNATLVQQHVKNKTEVSSFSTNDS